MPWDLTCPACRAGLLPMDADAQRCPRCDITYRRENGIWRLLAKGRQEALREFIVQYETVRAEEGRRVQNPDHLRALPFRDRSRKRPYEWYIRSQSYKALIRRVIRPLERASIGPFRIIDLGSGLGWLANRLALRGHQVAAVDLVTNDFDGLGVHRHYEREFISLQAEFDHLPFPDRSVDLAIYNGSFHYAADYAATLREALRVLAPRGRVVIMDSPLYRDGSSGRTMVREREDAFAKQYGFHENTILAEGFVTYDRLTTLEGELAVRWEVQGPWHGVRWWLKPWVARLRGLREPAQFKLIVGHRLGESQAP
jgi:SAM-dependent methyltransferase